MLQQRQGGRTGSRGKQLGESSVGSKGHGSDDRVADGKPRLRWEGATLQRRHGGRTGNRGK